MGNTETITIQLDATNQLTESELIGRLVFTSNASSSPDTFPINFFVVDTIVLPVIDTIYTGRLSGTGSRLALAISNTANYGNQGDGNVNLDWQFSGLDCDTSSAAGIYLYDGSAIVGTNAANLSWSIFGDGILDTNGLRPLGAHKLCEGAPYDRFRTGVVVSQDSTIAIEKFWYAPSNNDNNDFIIQHLKVWSFDGNPQTVLIGEAIDWDIPSDSGSSNSAGFDFVQNLIYQSGAEYDQDPFECQNNNTRYGGMSFIGGYLNNSSTPYITTPFSAHIMESAVFVYPASGFDENELWTNMNTSGFSATDSVEDLHMIMCFDPARSISAADTVHYYIVLSTVLNGTATDLVDNISAAKAWFTAQGIGTITELWCGGCCEGTLRGNFDGGPDDIIDIGDLLYMVDYQFGSPAGPAPPCDQEGDYDASGSIDIGDLLAMVDYQFGNPTGPPPASCP